jgi:hypothetical protein
MGVQLKGRIKFKNESHWYVVKAICKQCAHLVDPTGQHKPVLLVLKNG